MVVRGTKYGYKKIRKNMKCDTLSITGLSRLIVAACNLAVAENCTNCPHLALNWSD